MVVYVHIKYMNTIVDDSKEREILGDGREMT